jgi:hypothetical protein
MKKSEAIKHLNNFMIVLQKYRSNARESLGEDISNETLAWINPYVFGDKCPLEILVKVSDHGDSLEPMTYYNLMVILYRFMPKIDAAARITGAELPGEIPSTALLAQGWEDEEAS